MKRALILLVLSLAHSQSYAGDPYIGFGVGSMTLDISSSDADRIDDTDNYLKVFIGTSSSQAIALEFSYIDLGEVSAHFVLFDETDTATGHVFTGSAVFGGELSDDLRVFGKLGIAAWTVEADAEATVFGFALSGSGKGNGTDPFFGIGFDYQINEKTSLRGEFEKFKDVGEGVDVEFEGLGSVELEGGDVDLLGIGLVFKI